MHNVVSILNSGKLYSRNKAKSLGLLQVDIANDEVISHTNITVYDYVRFYFGAKTPTLFHNEGIKPLDEIKNNAHCPVPVFLLFDFVKILSLDNIYFSNGKVGASSPQIYDDINILPQLEWNSIYHRDSLYGYSEDAKRHIVYCRNAIDTNLKENYSDMYDKYIEIFKLNERYKAHKDIVFDIIQKAELYPESRLKELENLTSIPFQQIKKDIFNFIDENEDLSKQSFSKLVVDMSKELGIL